jgi:hypothetical protein
MTRYSFLRSALAANAAFSFVTGAALIAAPTVLAELTGLPAGWVLPAVGVQLLGWGAFAGWQAARRETSIPLALATSVGDFGWVLATGVGLAGWGELLTTTGVGAVIGVALCVGSLGAAQVIGVRRGQVPCPVESRGRTPAAV